jgi:hypothetical protein
MPVGSAVQSQFSFAIEATQNTRVAPNKHLGYVQEGVRGGPAQVKSRAMRAGRILPHRFSSGVKSWEGPVAFELQPETFGSFARACWDGTPVTAGAGPFTHTFAPSAATAGDLKSLTCQFGRPDNTGTVRCHEYTGVLVRSWSLTVEPQALYAMFSAVLTAYDEDLTQTLATASYSATETPLTFAHLSLSVAGSEVPIDSITLNGDNAIDSKHKATATAAGRPTLRPAGQRVYGGTFQTDFISNTQYQRFLNGTEGALVLTLEASASAKIVITMNVRYLGETPNVGGRDEVLAQGCPFEVVHATADGSAFTAVVTSADATV